MNNISPIRIFNEWESWTRQKSSLRTRINSLSDNELIEKVENGKKWLDDNFDKNFPRWEHNLLWYEALVDEANARQLFKKKELFG